MWWILLFTLVWIRRSRALSYIYRFRVQKIYSWMQLLVLQKRPRASISKSAGLKSTSNGLTSVRLELHQAAVRGKQREGRNKMKPKEAERKRVRTPAAVTADAGDCCHALIPPSSLSHWKLDKYLFPCQRTRGMLKCALTKGRWKLKFKNSSHRLLLPADNGCAFNEAVEEGWTGNWHLTH